MVLNPLSSLSVCRDCFPVFLCIIKKQSFRITAYVHMLISVTVLMLLKFRLFLILAVILINIAVSVLTPSIPRNGEIGFINLGGTSECL